jgi:hypothetical protein
MTTAHNLILGSLLTLSFLFYTEISNKKVLNNGFCIQTH